MPKRLTSTGRSDRGSRLAGRAHPTPAVPSAEPIVYTVKFPSPEKHVAEVEAVFPTEKRPSIELMMAVWSPGFYRVEDYAKRVEGLSARTPDGMALEVEHRRRTGGGSRPRRAEGCRVLPAHLQTGVGHDQLRRRRPGGVEWRGHVHHAGRARLAARMKSGSSCRPKWKRSVTALEPAPDGRRTTTEPLITTRWSIRRSSPEVRSSTSSKWTAASTSWWTSATSARGTAPKAAAELKKIVRGDPPFLGFSPVQDVLLSQRVPPRGRRARAQELDAADREPRRGPPTAQASFRWLSFVSHEYFHAFNVKRLRPVELGPFDYEHPPHDRQPVDCRGAHDLLRRSDRRPRRPRHDRRISGRDVVAHRPAPELTRAAGSNPRAVFPRRLELRHFGSGPQPDHHGQLLRQGARRGVPARRQDPARDGGARRAWTT